MPKVTIIMPSLNVAQYITSCMDSVRNQTLRDIEILAIDAGSDDGTLEILQEYAALDKRIKIIHSDQKSYGYQLNMGILLACGEYVGVVETDDKIVPDMFQTLYERAAETGADYVKGCGRSFMEISPEIIVTSRITGTPSAGEMEKTVSPRQHPEFFVTDRFLWLGLYRSEFIKTIRLNETPGAAFQDIGFMFQVISKAGSAVYMDKDVYFYRQDNGGASSYDRKGFRYLTEEYEYVSRFLEKKGREWQRVYYEKMLNQCLGRFQMMAVSGEFWEDAAMDMEVLRENLSEAVENEILSPGRMAGGRRKLLELFLKGIREIYGYYVCEFQKKKKVIYDILKIVKHHKVVIFGCGASGRFFHALLEKDHSGTAMVYCDNNPGLWNTKVQGLQVIAPEAAVHCQPDAIYVIASVKSARDMQQQLYGLGVADSHICIFQERADMTLLQMK